MTKLEQAIKVVKSGDRIGGRKLLIQVLKEEPENETAWLWLSVTLDEPERKKQCFQRVLKLNPENVKAQKALAQLENPTASNVKETLSTKKQQDDTNGKKKRSNSMVFAAGFLGVLMICLACILLASLLPSDFTDNNIRLTKEDIIAARRNYEVAVINFDASQGFGTSRPFSDYVRLKITNNSDVSLPYLTVRTNRYSGSGELIGWSRAPSIDVSSLAPGESAEYDYYPKGHLSGVTNITVEIEQQIGDDVIQFFKEFENAR